MNNPEKLMIEMNDGAFLYAEYWKTQATGSQVYVPAIIMIPGFCCTTESFRHNAPVLADTYDVIVYDPRGQGRSSKTLQGHTVAENARDLRKVMEYFGKKRYVIVAWSMAGQFIMDYVRQYGDELLSAIVTADCPLHAMGEEPWNAHGLRGYNMDHLNAHLQIGYNHWEEYCRDFARKIWGGIDDSQIEWATQQFVQTPPWIAFAIYSDMVYRNGFPYLAKTKVPILFTGADSKVTANGIALAAQFYPEGRPADTISESCIFQNGGHVFFDVEADVFNQALKDFIKKHCIR